MFEPDPAAVRIGVRLDGLDHHEAASILRATPAGGRLDVRVTQPPLGGLRHSIVVDGLSMVGAIAVLQGLLDHANNVTANGWEATDVAA